MKSIRFCQNIKLSQHTSASSAAHSLGNTGLDSSLAGHSVPNEQMGDTSVLYFNEIWHTCDVTEKLRKQKNFL